MLYVDGFVLAVPKRTLPADRRMAAKASRIWREHGAIVSAPPSRIGYNIALEARLHLPRP